MTHDRFVRWYGALVISVALTWRSALLVISGAPLDVSAAVFGIGLGVLPFATLASLAHRVRARWVLILSASTALLLDVAVALAVLLGRSSNRWRRTTPRPDRNSRRDGAGCDAYRTSVSRRARTST